MKDISFDIDKLETFENGAKYKIMIKFPLSIGWIDKVEFNIESSVLNKSFQMSHVKNEGDLAYFETEVELPTRALYYYFFKMHVNNKWIYIKNNLNNNDKVSRSEMWKMSVNFEVPDWAKGKIMYHVFIDRFNKSKGTVLKDMPNRTIHKNWDEDIVIGEDKNGRWNADFYGGNLKGIIEKLDYLYSLGVSIIYLSPVVLSQSNHRYDTADYEVVDPYAGDNEDLKELCSVAHKMGMKVILDAVFNHTGNDSKYFNQYNNFPDLGAFQSKDSKYYSFYRKHNFNNKTYFDYWWGMTNLPVCDGNSKKWQDYIYGEGGIIDLWFSLGIDGLRLDVADELSDDFIKGIRQAVKRNKEDGFILGEVWKNPMRMNRGYIDSGVGMDSVMNYQLVDALIKYYKYGDCDTLRYVINELVVEYPDDTLNSLMNFTSTHDITRAINIFGTDQFQKSGEWSWNLVNNDRYWEKEYKMSDEEYNLGKRIYGAYIYTLAFLPGNLSIFYGDEIGMQGMGNLANRRPFTWNKIDKDILNLFKEVGKIRKREEYLETARLELVDVNYNYLAFKRVSLLNELLILINRTNDRTKIILPEDYLNGETLYKLNDSSKKNLDTYGGLVLKKVKK